MLNFSDPEQTMADVLEQQLVRHVQTLAGEIGARNVYQRAALEAAARYIESELSDMGYAVGRLPYAVSLGVECANLEVVLPGERWPGESIVVGAHYDTVYGSPGADDNASAVAALIEIARLLREHSPGRTLKLVAFVNEEPPFFFWGEMGSQVYARTAQSQREDIRLMISLEMLGYYRDEVGSQAYPPVFGRYHPDRADFIAFVSNIRSRHVMHRAAQIFRDGSDFPLETTATWGWLPGIAWSDHFPFWRKGYRAFMCTDTAFFRNPHYHAADDTPDKLDYPRLAKLTGGLAGMLKTLSDSEAL